MSLNLSIIGAPKSGTSSVFYWLNDHPEVAASSPKETFFFMDIEHPLCGRHGISYNVDGIDKYEQFFKNSLNRRIRFEGTTHYFYQPTARDFLTALKPQPYVVMILREPAKRVLSSFRFTRDNLANCNRDLRFNQYVEWLLNHDVEKMNSYYRDLGSLWIAKKELELSCYVNWLDWWLEKLSPDRLKIFLFEELRANPVGFMMNLSNFLEIDPNFYQDYIFKSKNETYPIANQALHYRIRKLASKFPKGNLKQALKTIYIGWQGQNAPEDEEYEEGIVALRNYFAPHNQRLENRFQLNLKHWWGEEAMGLNETNI